MARIKKRRDFLAAARAATCPTPGFVLQGRRRPDDHPGGVEAMRLGLTTSKKVGPAVTRNRARRRLRALGDAVLSVAGRSGWDYVLVGRRDATAERDFATMKAELFGAVARVHAGGKMKARGGAKSRKDPAARAADRA